MSSSSDPAGWPMLFRQHFLKVRWGEKSIVALYLSILSGVVVALQYDPAEPFYSLSTIEVLAPFGSFWRALHYYTSQLFFLLSLCHLAAIIWDNKHGPIPRGRWVLLIMGLVTTLLLLFTGYVLRGDATGASAGVIAENILLAVPLVGRWLNELLFAVTTAAMKRVYANHLIGLGALWLVLSWDHFRRYRVRIWLHPYFVCTLLLVSALWPATMEPERLGMLHIAGPWFFLGLQELLRYVQPFWAGVLFPCTFIVSLCLLPEQGRIGRAAGGYAALWLLAYAVLSAVGFARGLAGSF